MEAGTVHAEAAAADPLRVARRTGLIGSAAVAVAALVGGPPPLALDLEVVRTGTGALATLFAFYGGLAMLIRAWVMLRRAAREHTVSRRKIVAVVALWAAPLLLGPPVGSKDLYAYTAQGTLVASGHNPYEVGPDALDDGPVLDAVDPLWRATPVPYGPAWLAVSAAASAVPGPEPLSTVVVFRVVAIGSLGLLAWGATALASRMGRDPTDALVLVAANPLVLVHGIGGGHNDLLLAALLVAALGLVAGGRRMLGLVLLGLAAGIKVPALLVAAHVGWFGLPGASSPERSVVRRGTTAAATTAVAAAVLWISGAVTGLGLGWIAAIDVGEKALSFLAPSTWIGLVVGDADLFHNLFRVLSILLAAVVLLAARRSGAAMAPGLALLALGVLGPIVQPWYILWGLPLVAIELAGRPARWVVAGTAIATLVSYPGQFAVFAALSEVDPALIVAAVLIALALLNPAGIHRDTETAGSPAPEPA